MKPAEPCEDRYPAPTDDDSSMLERLDFSQAFKRTQVGTALCFTNPMHQKFLEHKLSSVQREQRRRHVKLYHVQRTFFIEQVFEKGLNPYINKGKTNQSCSAKPRDLKATDSTPERPRTINVIPSPGRGAADGLQVRSQTNPEMRRPLKRTKIPQGEITPRHVVTAREASTCPTFGSSTQTTLCEVPADKKSVSPPSYGQSAERSQTLPLVVDTSQSVSSAPSHVSKVMIVSSAQEKSTRPSTRFPKLTEHEENSDGGSEFSHAISESPVNGRDNADESSNRGKVTPVLKMGAAQGPSRSQRRDIEYLKRNPTHLFPKMKELLDSRDVDEVEHIDLDAEYSRLLKEENKVDGRKVSGADLKKRASLPDKGAQVTSMDYVKLIQKLSTYLPEHLADTAKQQMREMTQTDVIYEQKGALLAHNKTNLRRDAVISDLRWRRLQGSLCNNYAENGTSGPRWKQLFPAGPWKQVH